MIVSNLHAALLEAYPDGVLAVRLDGRILAHNRRYREIWGVSEIFLAGATRETLDTALKPLVADVSSALISADRAYRDPAITIFDSVELRDGRMIERRSSGLIGQPEIPDCRVWFYRDVTGRRAREAQLEAARSQLEKQATALAALADSLDAARRAAEAAARDARQANQAKSRFLAHMSHELRTPLNAIIGFSDMMRQQIFGKIGNQRYLEYIIDIMNSGEHLLSVINDILDLSKVEAGKMEVRPEAVDAMQIATACLSLVRGMALDGGIRIDLTAAEGTGTMHADPRIAKQMLANLLSNAIKFTPPGGRVTLAVEQRPDAVALTVTDTGIGMTREEVAKALEPFGQVDSKVARQQRGTGLGLPLVKVFAELHGGSLSVTSERGQGTKATITFPPIANLGGL